MMKRVIQLQPTILALLKLFRGHVPDTASNSQVASLIADVRKWPEAHDLFADVRRRLLATCDNVLDCQYSFEEICLKTVYNETDTDAPFDRVSPFWVVPMALELAKAIRLPIEDVVAIVAPD
jgi:hypothetical protein